MRPSQIRLFDDVASAPTIRDVADAIREAGIEALPDATRRADEARYQELRVRSALTESKGMPFRWALNPYRGCTHACEYCYARKYQKHFELGAGEDFSSLIFVKTNLIAVLRREVQSARWKRESVAIGTATDPYQPIEGHYRLTRRALEVFADACTPISIITKGPMIVRDIDLLRRLTEVAACRVYVSVPSVDEQAWARLESGTASPAQRLRAVRQLHEAGIDVGVFMSPLVPGITTSRDSITRTLDAIAASGARLAGSAVAHLDDGVRQHFFAFLEREYPSLLAGYERLYARGAYPPVDYVREVKATVARLQTPGR